MIKKSILKYQKMYIVIISSQNGAPNILARTLMIAFHKMWKELSKCLDDVWSECLVER
jgi:hypothetical protein